MKKKPSVPACSRVGVVWRWKDRVLDGIEEEEPKRWEKVDRARPSIMAYKYNTAECWLVMLKDEG